jgi:NADH:ubiquinone oxidoreductase subunit 2 (subunit N)
MIEFLSLKDLAAFSELFFSISIIYILLVGSLVAYNGTYSFPLIQLPINATGILILSMACFLFYNDHTIILDYLSFSETIVNDYLGFSFKIIIGISVIIYFIITRQYLKSQKFNHFEFTILIFFATLGLFILCFSNDLITSYLAIELQSLAFYVMATSKRNSSHSIESGLKYFVLGSFSSALLLFGSSLIFGLVGSVNFEDFKDLFFWSFSANSALLASNSLIEALSKCEEEIINCNTTYYDSDLHLKFVLDKFLMLKQHSYFSVNDARLFKAHLYEDTLETIQNSKRNDLYINLADQIRINMFSDQSISRKFFFESRFENRELTTSTMVWDMFFHTWGTMASRMSFFSGMFYDQNIHFLLYPSYVTSIVHGPIWFFENGARTDLNLSVMLDVKMNHLNIWSEFVRTTNERDLLLDLTTLANQFNVFFVMEDWLSSSFFTLFDVSLVEVGLMFILLSIFLKLALAPLHLWSISVYEGSPTNASFFFAAISKLSFFVLLTRICYSSFYSFVSSWQIYCLLFAVYSVLVGSIGGLEQRKLKSLLAYSSIAHMGYCIVAFSSCSIEGIQMLICYLIIYTISGLCIWSILSIIQIKTPYATKQNKDLGDLAQIGKSNPILAFVATICLFSMAGLPPMVGFFY